MNLQLTNSILYGALHPKCRATLPFNELWRKLSALPASLPELQQALGAVLCNYVRLQFEDALPDITALVSDAYTPVEDYPVSPEIEIAEEVALEDTPQTRLYNRLLYAEFSQFAHSEKSTTSKTFSTPPASYFQDIKNYEHGK